MKKGSPLLCLWSTNFQQLPFSIQDYLPRKLTNTIERLKWKEQGRGRRDFNSPMMHKYLTQVCCTKPLLMYTASTSIHPSLPLHFDLDSFPIMVNNCATTLITSCLQDFVEPPSHSNKSIQGIGGGTTALKGETVTWHILDDQGCPHILTLPDTYYAPQAPHRLLSPQHWSQVTQDTAPHPDGTWCATYADKLVLWWDQRKYKCTIRLGATNNVATLYTMLGAQCFANSCQLLEKYTECVLFPSTIDVADSTPMKENGGPQPLQQMLPTSIEETLHPQPLVTDFNVETGDSNVLEDQLLEHPIFDNAQEELLNWHYRSNHLSFHHLRQMADYGLYGAKGGSRGDKRHVRPNGVAVDRHINYAFRNPEHLQNRMDSTSR